MNPSNIIRRNANGYIDLLEYKCKKGGLDLHDFEETRRKIDDVDLINISFLDAVDLIADWILKLPGAKKEEIIPLLAS